MVYHAGEYEVQARTGEFDDAMQVASAIRPFVPPPLARFLTTQPWIMVGAADLTGRVWATALCGPPGFVRAADGATILIEALPPRGDPLEQLSGAVPAGLLAIDLGRRMRARINGMLRRRETGFTLDVEQAYPNCMKYIQRREFTQGDPHPAGSGGPSGLATTADHLSIQDIALVRAADTGDLLHLSGSASVDFDPPPDQRHPGAPRIITVTASRVVRRAAALPFRYGTAEYSPFLPQRPGVSHSEHREGA